MELAELNRKFVEDRVVNLASVVARRGQEALVDEQQVYVYRLLGI